MAHCNGFQTCTTILLLIFLPNGKTFRRLVALLIEKYGPTLTGLATGSGLMTAGVLRFVAFQEIRIC